MNIYLLNRIGRGGWDVANGFVVVAEDEYAARLVASKRAGDEGDMAWRTPAESTCVLMGQTEPDYTKESHIVLRSFRAG